MDFFNIPKVVNRHVLRAVKYLTEIGDTEMAPIDDIKNRVKFTLQNRNPIKDLEDNIQYSLNYLTMTGRVLERNGTYKILQMPQVTVVELHNQGRV